MQTSKKIGLEYKLLTNQIYQTPYFLFSKSKIINKFQDFQNFFPKASIHYAMKANSEPEILQLLLEAGSNFEVASVYELNILKKLGVPPYRILYGSAIKPISHIKDFFNYGVDIFAFDSLSELEKIAEVAPGARVYVRTIVNDIGSIFKFSEKFGTEKENIIPLLEKAKKLGLVPYGISFNVGSQASNPMAWANALNGLRDSIEELFSREIKIEIINIGGGYPCNYKSMEVKSTLQEIAHNTLAAYNKLPYKPKIIMEPGRGIIATSGILITTIIGKVERRNSTWIFLDAGVYDSLFEAMAYQGSTQYKITSLRPSNNSDNMLFALAGPTGDSCDVITREALLPRDIGIGDKLIIHDVGAYSLSVSSRFNGFPKPSVYLI